MPSGPADPRATFGPAAERYAASAVHASASALERLVRIAKPGGGLLLDVATGSGHTAHAFAPFVDRVVATDITLEMLWVCRREAAAKGLRNFEVCMAQAAALPFLSGAFDAVTCRLAPHHFPNPALFVMEVSRALKPGGWFLLVDTVGSDDVEATRDVDKIETLRDPSHAENLPMSRWRAHLESCGFEVEFQQESPKELELQDWMDRTSTPSEVQSKIRSLIEASSGALREYLNPSSRDGRDYFELREGVFFSLKRA